MKGRLLLISVVILFFSWLLPAQNPFIRLYTTSDGLPSNKIIWMMQDSRNFIWIAAWGGLVRYDGSTFTHFGTREGLSNSQVIFLKEDSFGRIWLACAWGKMNYYFNNKIFNETNTPFLSDIQRTPLILEDGDHNLYFYSYYGNLLCVLDTNNKITVFKLPSEPLPNDTVAREGMNIRYLTKTASGEFLIWTQLGLFKTKNLNQEPIPVSYSDKYHNILPYGNDLMYDLIPNPITQTSLYVKYFKGSVVDSIEFPVKSLSDEGWIAEDTPGTLWICRYDKGLFCLKNGKIVYQFEAEDAECVFKDHEGNIWLSAKKGIYKISPNVLLFKHYDNSYFQSEGIDALSSNPEGGVWCVGSGKVFLYKNNEFYNLPVKQLINAPVLINGMLNNSVVIADAFYKHFAFTGIKNVPNSKNLQYSKLINLHAVGGILEVNNSKTEFSICNGSIFELVRFSYKNDFQEIDRRPSAGMRMFYTAHDDIYMGTSNHVILKNDIWVLSEDFKSFHGKGMPIHCTINPETDLVYTSEDSIYLVNNKKAYNLTAHFNYTLNAQIQKIIYDAPTLYISTLRNIYKCDNPLDVLKNKPVHFQLIDVNFKEIRDILVNKDSLYIASSEGLTIIPENKIDSIKNPIPLPYFQSVSINDKEVDFSIKEYSMKGRNKISINFESINYSHNPVIFSYILDGYDEDWITETSKSVNYTNLPIGHYKFKLRVSKFNSSWSEPIEFAFTVKATIWQRPIFFAVLFLILTGLVFFAILSQKNAQIKHHEIEHQLLLLEQRSLQSMMNPHFIFNSLGSIQSYILQNKNQEAGLYLSQFARLIRQNLNAISSTMVNLDDETERLRNYLELEKMRLPGKFEYFFQIDETIEVEETFIPSMIIQPFAENAIWHGISPIDSLGQITISFKKISLQTIEIVIEDNGIGIENSKKSHSKGESHLHLTMGVVRKRLELLSKKMNIPTSFTIADAFPGEVNPGTKVTLILPFTYS